MAPGSLIGPYVRRRTSTDPRRRRVIAATEPFDAGRGGGSGRRSRREPCVRSTVRKARLRAYSMARRTFWDKDLTNMTLTIESKSQTGRLASHSNVVTSVAFSPDGRYLAS